ncbi:MAG: cadherin-like domain-containing protein, partial [Alphaproteobacteria bacterium]|nr:cadherin-like domain-containing protein [Alphaproteobacteria bacterium]
AGEDRFYYIVFDNNGNASSGRAIISVIDNTAPVAVDDIVVTNKILQWLFRLLRMTAILTVMCSMLLR